MGPLGVVEPDPFRDDPADMEAIDEFMQMDGFAFERAPQPLYKDVVHAPAAAVHGDRHPGVFEPVRELDAGELAALERVSAPCIGLSAASRLLMYRKSKKRFLTEST